MKTIIAMIGLTFGLASPAGAFENNPLRTFATCAGRLSAVMEFQWMFDGPESIKTQEQRANVLDLVAAVMAPDQGRTVLHWRLSGKRAQSLLLTRATFNDDPEDAAWALQQALWFEHECTGLLLS